MNAPSSIVHTDFVFTTVGWYEIEWDKRTQNSHLGNYLEQKINMYTFGSKVESIRFIPIIGPPKANTPFSNEIIYHRSRKELGLYWRMDYDRVMKSTLPEFKAYLADFFIEVLEIAKATKRIRDFDYEGFISAVKAILPEWVAAVPEV